MNVTYLHHSGFLVETDRFYCLFDYESGSLPPMDSTKPIFVLSSHGHSDHYNPAVFPLLRRSGMERIRAVLSDDIQPPEEEDCLSVSAGKEYILAPSLKLTTFRSTDLGVAFLMEDQGRLIYHAGDLNDWVWAEETPEYNHQMTLHYREQIRLLAQTLDGREIDTAFVVLDPRQEKDYHRGLCCFLENIPVKQVYPMHYWDDPSVMETFLHQYPRYASQIRKTE